MAKPQQDMICEPRSEYGDLAFEQRSIRRRPRRADASSMERLIASGRIKPAKADLLSLGLPQGEPNQLSISDALNEQRSES